jgi:crotonobetainyl-CoA:carnitine CoA-transferase CaiB-like acyl-CoA transferase
MSDYPLRGIRVIEVGTGEAVALAARTMAGYGAEVIKVEPPGGDPSRGLGPFPPGAVGPDTGAAWHYFHGGKQSVVLDLGEAAGRQVLAALAGQSQLLLTDVPAAQRSALGLDREELRAASPALSVVSVTPYGEQGPYAGWAASEITEFAIGGQMSLMGDADREPLKAFHNQAEMQASLHVLGAALAALFAARAGTGQHVDISVQEIQASTLEAQGPMALNGDALPATLLRMGNGGRMTWGQFECQDGYVGAFVNVMNLPSFFRAIGHPELLDRAGEDEFIRGEGYKLVAEWCAARTKQQVYDAAVEFGAPLSYVAEPADIIANPDIARTGIWRTVPHPVAGWIRVPGPPFRSDDMSFDLTAAPSVGQHTSAVLGDLLGVSAADAALMAAQSGAAGRNAATSDGAAALPATAPGTATGARA